MNAREKLNGAAITGAVLIGGLIGLLTESWLLALGVIGWIIIVPPFVTIARFQGRIREAQRMAGVEQRANFWGWFGRALLLSYAFKWNQDHFNEIAVRQPQA